MPEGRVTESMPQRKRSEECSELHSPSWRLAVLYPEPVEDDWSLGQAELLLRMPAICGTIEELFPAGVQYCTYAEFAKMTHSNFMARDEKEMALYCTVALCEM